MATDIVTHTTGKEQALNSENVTREIDQEHKQHLVNDLKQTKKTKSALEIICEFKVAAQSKISELKNAALLAGFTEADESVQSILYMSPDEFSATYQQSSLIDLQNKLKTILEELSRAEELEIVIHSMNRNERGDAELFLYIHKGKYVFDSTHGKNGEFYVWNGVHWQLDLDKQRYRDMEDVSKKYEWAASQISDPKLQDINSDENLKKELVKRAKELRSARRCANVFVFVASHTPFKSEWDYCPGLLPCLNGIIDLKNGNLIPHNPGLYIRNICSTNYIKNAQRPLFEQFLDDIMLGNEEMKGFIKRVKGSAIYGVPKEEKIFYLYGEKGRNGKGTLEQTLEKILGSIAKTFPSEMLLRQSNPPSSSNASPELANLQGVRFAIFSEINKGRKIDASKVKNLSGRDSISCRRLFSNVDLNITPTHTMFIQTNYKPEAPSDDDGLWKRNILIPFNAEFVEDPKLPHQRKLDPEFKDKLISEKEGILAWLVEGCLEYQEHGLNIPGIVKEETENYRKENDGIAVFLEERCVIDSAFSTPGEKMRKSIKTFCEENGFTIPSERDIKDYLEKIFQRQKTNKGIVWKGVSIPQEQCTEVNR